MLLPYKLFQPNVIKQSSLLGPFVSSKEKENTAPELLKLLRLISFQLNGGRAKKSGVDSIKGFTSVTLGIAT
jgi:hypothetical protein